MIKFTLYFVFSVYSLTDYHLLNVNNIDETIQIIVRTKKCEFIQFKYHSYSNNDVMNNQIFNDSIRCNQLCQCESQYFQVQSIDTIYSQQIIKFITKDSQIVTSNQHKITNLQLLNECQFYIHQKGSTQLIQIDQQQDTIEEQDILEDQNNHQFNSLKKYSINYSSNYSKGEVVFYLHAILLFVAWGVIADVGIIIARFYKYSSTYLQLHALCFTIVDILTVVLVILMLTIGSQDEEEEDKDVSESVLSAHSTISVILMGAVFLQHLVGLVCKHFLEEKTMKNNSFVVWMKFYHAILGSTMYLLAKIDILLGLIFNDVKIFLVLYIVWIVLLFLIRGFLEYNRRQIITLKYKIQPPQNQINADQKKLMELLNARININKIKEALPHILWVTVNAEVFDLTDYQHPGGNFIFSQVCGREVSRFFYGAYGLESTEMKPYVHSQKAYISLMTRYIGTIDNSKYQIKGNIWKMHQIKQITNNILQFEFTQPNLQLPLNQNIEDFGQHFSLSFQEFGGKTRMYTKVMSMNEHKVEYRIKLVSFVKEFLSGQQSQELPKISQTYSDTLPLIIKKYNFPDALSAQIENHKEDFYIDGPFGQGLEIASYKSATCFVGGTGLLPLLDLLDFLLMKTIYLLVSDKSVSLANELFQNNDQLQDDFQFNLLATFNNEEEFIGREWIRDLYEFNKNNGMKLFNMKVRYSNKFQDPVIPNFSDRFTHDFIVQELGDFTSQIYICGPPKLNEQLLTILGTTKHPQENIIII